MPTQAQMKAALQEYVDAFNARDAQRIIALFAENATVEDPIGAPLKRGIAEVGEFYRGSVQLVDRIELAAPIRGSHGAAAAMAFVVHLNYEGKPCQISVIDVMEFDPSGRIASMKAYWGPDDVRFLT